MKLPSRGRGKAALCMVLALAALAVPNPRSRGASPAPPAAFDEEMGEYGKAKEDTVVSRLQKRLAAGEVKLAHDENTGYLSALLDALKAPRSSQTLVFSKTSFQGPLISPSRPRALFFNENVYVGWIPGAPVLEISAVDAKLGAVFYTLEQTKAPTPKLARNDQCLECHSSAKSLGVPGHLARSFHTGEDGRVDLLGGVQVNHRTPFEERWGGWYVTGAPPGLKHMGNLAGKEAFARREREADYQAAIPDLTGLCDTSRYPLPTSDFTALVVLEHQTHLQNFLTRLNFESQLHLAQEGHLRHLENLSEAFLKYLLFAEEAHLSAPQKGKSEFAVWFESQGPRDKKGRSLREFDLRTRTFKYPCSFLIYSDAFHSLPPPMKAHLYRRLLEILSGEDQSPDYQKIPKETKLAIREILAETKTDLPIEWHLR